jgi:hypothetical protein
MPDFPLQCSLCGRSLPNRFAIGGWADSDQGPVPYCQLHWQEKKAQSPQKDSPLSSSQNYSASMDSEPKATPAPSPADPQRSRQAMKESLRLIKKLGASASGLIARLRKSKTPEEMMAEMQTAYEANQTKRTEISSRLEALHQSIASGKKTLESASPARRRILEMELKAKLKEYQAAERTLKILLENEQTLSLVRGRLEEIHVYGMSGISEDFIDEITDQVESAADAAEDRSDAIRDLERAGRRRERDSGEEDLLAALEAFGEPETISADPGIKAPQRKEKTKGPLADFDEPES